MNAKQLKYSQKKVFKAIQNTKLRMFLVLMLIVAVPATIEAVTNFDNAKDAVAVVGGASMASMMVIGNIGSVSDNEVAGEALAYKVWLIHEDQVDDSTCWSNPNENREISNIPLKPGEKAHFFRAHDIPEYNSSGERGDLTISATNTFTIIMGGMRDQLLNFVEKFAGGKFFIIFEECGSHERYILGNHCRPMVLKSFNARNNKEARAVTLTFENRSIKQYHRYTGTFETPQPPPQGLHITTRIVSPTLLEFIPYINGSNAFWQQKGEWFCEGLIESFVDGVFRNYLGFPPAQTDVADIGQSTFNYRIDPVLGVVFTINVQNPVNVNVRQFVELEVFEILIPQSIVGVSSMKIPSFFVEPNGNLAINSGSFAFNLSAQITKAGISPTIEASKQVAPEVREEEPDNLTAKGGKSKQPKPQST